MILVADIQRAVAEHYGMGVDTLLSPTRRRKVARPRQVAMALCREHTARSQSDIATRFGLTNHATVIHAVKRINALRLVDAELDQDVRLISERLAA